MGKRRKRKGRKPRKIRDSKKRNRLKRIRKGKGSKNSRRRVRNPKNKKGNNRKLRGIDVSRKKRGKKGKKGKRSWGKKGRPESMKDLDKRISKDDGFIEPGDYKRKKINPVKIEKQVANQWKNRFKGDDYKPNRLNINYASTTERFKKFADKDGNFNTSKYLRNAEDKAVIHAQKRGLKGNPREILQRRSPELPKPTPPKYGGAIDELRNKLGKINYQDKIKETTSNQTKTINDDSARFEKMGLDLIKPAGSEDSALRNTPDVSQRPRVKRFKRKQKMKGVNVGPRKRKGNRPDVGRKPPHLR